MQAVEEEVSGRLRLFVEILFFFKTRAFQLRRLLRNSLNPIPRLGRGDLADFSFVLGESRTPLCGATSSSEEILVLGKIQNLRIAARELHGLEMRPQDLFSFWNQLGRVTGRRGYAKGRELRQGCLVPSVGGGLCQLSNGLYDAALQAGLEVVERHAHSRTISGSAAEAGRDATIFWNYVDLRFRGSVPILIETFLTQDHLVVRLRGKTERERASTPIGVEAPATIDADNHSCDACRNDSCYRSWASTESSSSRSLSG